MTCCVLKCLMLAVAAGFMLQRGYAVLLAVIIKNAKSGLSTCHGSTCHIFMIIHLLHAYMYTVCYSGYLLSFT